MRPTKANDSSPAFGSAYICIGVVYAQNPQIVTTATQQQQSQKRIV